MKIIALLLCLSALPCGCRRQEGTARSQVVTVLAASSLTEAFEALERRFEELHPQVDVQLVFAGSQVLRLQVEQGMRAELFASANPQHLKALRTQNQVEPPQGFAYNELAILLAPGQPELKTFDQLPQLSSWVVGSEKAPIGIYTKTFFNKIGAELGPGAKQRILANVRSKEPNVRLVRSKVMLGQAQAAVVYRSDVPKSFKHFRIPARLNVRASYEMAMLRSAQNPGLGRLFLQFVRSKPGQAILEAHGFLPRGAGV